MHKVNGFFLVSYNCIVCSTGLNDMNNFRSCFRARNRSFCEWIIGWKTDRYHTLFLGKKNSALFLCDLKWSTYDIEYLLPFFLSLFILKSPNVKLFVGSDKKHFLNGTIDDVSI